MLTCKSKWFQPALAFVLGLVMLAAEWAGGHPDQGAASSGAMMAFAAILVFGGRSELVRDLRADDRDERASQIQLKAVAIAGHVTIVAVVVGFLVEVARGHDGHSFTWLGALVGLTYLAALRILEWRG
jgi:Na+/H+ antiporter NhaD/arsenite permease-like protein